VFGYEAIHVEEREEQFLIPVVPWSMGRKRDLKNVNSRRPPSLGTSNPESLNDWGESLERMTERRRMHNERNRPKRGSKA
tara:strand:+ start:148 stop:387 length:240 start_codon:yes stop_codon:yes gene_type:complete